MRGCENEVLIHCKFLNLGCNALKQLNFERAALNIEALNDLH